MTFSKLKAAALTIGCMFALQGCGEAVEVDVTRPEPSAAEIEHRERIAKMMAEYKEDMDQFAKVALVFKEQRCEEGLKQLEAAGTGETRLLSRDRFWTFRAILHIEGICVPRDPASAVDLLSDAIERYESPEAMARLGALYLQGDGVGQDTEKAYGLFRRAVLSQVESRLYRGPFKPDPIFAALVEIWGMSDRDMRHEFVSYLTGPWQLPAPLRAEMEWLEQVKAGGGEAIFETSEKFKYGTDDFDQDEKLAFIMLQIAAREYDYIPAQYPYAMALRDDELCPKRKPLCDILYREIDFGSSLPHIYLAAENDDLRAQQFLVDKLDHLKLPDDDTEDRRDSLNETYYYWILRLNLSREQSEDRIEEARQAVSRSERGWIEELVADKDPSGLLFYFREPGIPIKDFPANQNR